jgi:hypothetical protein
MDGGSREPAVRFDPPFWLHRRRCITERTRPQK